MKRAWYKRNPDLYAAEMSAVRRRFPDVRIDESLGCIVLEGAFPVRMESGSTLRHYRLRIVFPPNYPDWIPDSFMLETSVAPIAERHIEKNGRCCLCLPHEIPKGIRFDTYVDRLLTPWLVGQAFYDEHDRWPWPARDHNKKGILQGFAELLGITDFDVVERYARLLVRKNPAKGHEPCPCGRGKKLRDCHSDLYNRCREALPGRAMGIYREYFF